MATAATKEASWAGRALRVLTAPATWVERARGGKRWALLGLYALILAIPAPWVARSLSLRGLDDPGDPFDVAEFRARWDVPASDNARLGYERATGLLADPQLPLRPGGPLPAPSALPWISINRAALGPWLEATERPTYAAAEPMVPDDRVDWRGKLNHQSLFRLAELEAERLRQSGAVAEAWAYHLGLLRHTLHLAGSDRAIDRPYGDHFWKQAHGAAMLWARDDAVDAATLRRALADILALASKLPSEPDGFKVQYLAALAEIDSPPRDILEQARRELDERLPKDYSTLAYLPGVPRLRWFVQNDHERSRRVLRQLCANELSASAASVPVGPLGPPLSKELARWYDSTLILRSGVPWAPFYVRQQAAARRVEHGQLVVVVAEELFRRERGDYPDSLAELVGPYLDALPEGVDPDEPALIDVGPERPGAPDGPRVSLPRLP